MAYSPIKQAHDDPKATSYRGLSLARTPSPRPTDASFASLSLSFDDSPGDAAGEHLGTRPEHAEFKVSKFLSSLTSSRQSYDMVEDDDYEAMEQVTPTLERHPNAMIASAQEFQPVRSVPPMRTASVSKQLPLNHPMPDLQSLQGAYVKNVERLEESAERLSLKSGLEGELQRMRYEQWQKERKTSASSHAGSFRSGPQRQPSVRSWSNSIAEVNDSGRFGGYSPISHVPSPAGSLKSPRSAHGVSNHRLSKGSRLSHPLPEPEFEGRPLDSELTFHSPQSQTQPQPNFDLDPRTVRSPSISNASQIDRPTTSGSGDTYQQARSLFTDFDGVHYAPDRQSRAPRRISLTRPPRARDSKAFREPQPGEEMIYYPAPVPVMLNLPVRLSKMNWGDHEKKRLQALSNIPDDMRKSAAWLSNEDGIPVPNRKSIANLPPQLRASAFFEHRNTTQDVQLKDGSAVATLDSILDAAAHAPVSAFTDHPIAGHLGADFYSTEKSPRKSMQLPSEKKAKRKSSLSNLLRPKRSSGNMPEAMARERRVPSVMLSQHDSHESDEDHIEDEAERSLVPDEDELPDQDEPEKEGEHSDSGSDSHESQFQQGFSAAPTTLLAELQMRKAQQRMRNRTAVDAFPNGMHSTLLELDTVTQLQQKARRQKHVKLAWEDKDVVDRENFDDDDIPLGVLFPEKEQQSNVNYNRPLGLMEKKELEDNEPLSQRRARLRGEPLQAPAPARSSGLSQQGEQTEKPLLDMPDMDEVEHNEDEGETLAQRRQKLKDRKENGTSGEFARQLNAELDLKTNKPSPGALPSPSETETPDVEESLGQRRKRLQAEAMKNGGNQPVLRAKRSLADVLQANPVGYVDPNQGTSAQIALQNHERARERQAQYLAAQEADRQQAYESRTKFGNGHQGGLLQSGFSNYQGYQQPNHSAMNVMPTNYGYQNVSGIHMQPGYVNPTMGMMNVTNMQNNYPYHPQMVQGYGYQSAVDLSGMGPPLDPKQRARIEGWRQGIM